MVRDCSLTMAISPGLSARWVCQIVPISPARFATAFKVAGRAGVDAVGEKAGVMRGQRPCQALTNLAAVSTLRAGSGTPGAGKSMTP